MLPGIPEHQYYTSVYVSLSLVPEQKLPRLIPELIVDHLAVQSVAELLKDPGRVFAWEVNL